MGGLWRSDIYFFVSFWALEGSSLPRFPRPYFIVPPTVPVFHEINLRIQSKKKKITGEEIRKSTVRREHS